jgi:4-amino-4-deoxy-L-arabinose transferase-like glycosyltransferase
MTPPRERALVLAAAVLFCLLAAASAVRSSLTFDELAYIPAGHVQWVTGRVLLDLEHPPLSKWIVGFLPWLLGPELEPERLAGFATRDQWAFGAAYFARLGFGLETLVLLARAPVIVLGGALVLVVASLARRVGGSVAAVAAALLCASCPTLVAHFSFATTDGALTFFSALCAERAVAFADEPTRRRLLALGAALGAALATKHLAAALVPGLVAGGLVWALGAERNQRWQRLRQSALALAVVLALAFVVLAATYASASGILNFARDLRIMNRGFQAYLHGSFREQGFLSYFPVALGVKLPLPLLGLAGLGMVLVTRRRAEAWLWVGFGVTLLAVFAILTWKALGIGVRLALPVVPFLIVAASVAVRWILSLGGGRVLLAAFGLWSALGTVRAGSHPLRWFNEIAGGSERGLEWLDDSNVDWGDGLIALREWLATQPAQDVFIAHIPWYSPLLYGVGTRWFTVPGLVEILGSSSPQPGLYVLSEHQHLRLRLMSGAAVEHVKSLTPDARVGPFHVYAVR